MQQSQTIKQGGSSNCLGMVYVVGTQITEKGFGSEQRAEVSRFATRRRPLVVAQRGVDRHVAAVGPAQWRQALLKMPPCGPEIPNLLPPEFNQHADAPHRSPAARAPRAATPPRNELAPCRSITSSARASGTSAPWCLKVDRKLIPHRRLHW